jgi:hypothetical protein
MTPDEKRARKSEYNRRYREKQSPERAQNAQLKYKYGITLEQRDAMFAEQGHACAICGTAAPARSNKHQNWAVDHDHRTGAVRGILCHPCNLLLGNALDSPDTLAKAIRYLNDRTERDTEVDAKASA